ncbi:MAG: M23 family metallopeptidase, partial [Nitriliruptorales bacterium]|nr:M23 family metallopeptidase [Nitriliruptorales bacterium]
MQARRLLLGLALVLLALPTAAAGAEEPPVGYEDVIDLTFPVSGPTWFSDDYHACRSGCERRHKATDIMVEEYGQPVHAAVDGVVSWMAGLDGFPPSYGYMLRILGDDGRTYSYVHLGPKEDERQDEAFAPGIEPGVRVFRGQTVGFAGCSGNASCDWPHLHFSIADPNVEDPYGTDQVNPYPSLVAAVERGDLPPTEVSLPIPLTGDWDGDGIDTPGWFRDGTWILTNDQQNVTVAAHFTFGGPGDVPIIGDWDGDGVDTVGVVRGVEWQLRNANESGPPDVRFGFGADTDVPIVGNWDGIPGDEPGIRRGKTFRLRHELGPGKADVIFGFGLADDIPITGDFNADGTDDVGVVRDNAWRLKFTHSGGVADVKFHFARPNEGDVPVTADSNGDGRDTVGVVRDSIWRFKFEHAGGT